MTCEKCGSKDVKVEIVTGAKKLILIGSGGHAKVILSILNFTKNFQVFFVTNETNKVNSLFENIPIIALDSDLECLISNYQNAFVAFGSVGNPAKKYL